MKIFKIKKGKHKSVFFKPKFHFFKNQFCKRIEFNKSAKYQLDNIDQFDINKLFGISYGLHHRNSARFGWRWSMRMEKIEILAYVYRDGKRVNEWDENIYICDIEPNSKYNMEIKKENGYYNFKVENETLEKVYTLKIKHGECPFWGYELFPYFGGNNTAPHQIEIAIK